MSDAFVLKAEPRERVGKGSSRALRRNGQIPAVIYGEKEAPLAVAVPYKPVFLQIHAGGFMTKIMEIDYNGQKITVLPRDYQLDVIKDTPLHVDFLRISEKSRVTVEIPVHYINQEECVGITAGGVLNIVRHVIELDVPATAIPEAITVDVAALQIGDSVHISDVTLPPKAELAVKDLDFTLATIAAPEAEEEETPAEGEAAEGADAAAKPAEGEAKKEEAKDKK